MRLVVDANVLGANGAELMTHAGFRHPVVSCQQLDLAHASDVEIAAALGPDDILVTQDKNLAGRLAERDALVENRSRVVVVEAGNLTFYRQLGILLLHLDEAVRALEACEPPCKVTIKLRGVTKARRINSGR